MKKVNDSDWISIIDAAWGDRWQIYHRLQELEIFCKCSTGKPLTVNVDTPTTVVQVWSVFRTQSLDRTQLVDWLDRCFTLQTVDVDSLRQPPSSGGEASPLAIPDENRKDSELLYD